FRRGPGHRSAELTSRRGDRRNSCRSLKDDSAASAELVYPDLQVDVVRRLSRIEIMNVGADVDRRSGGERLHRRKEADIRALAAERRRKADRRWRRAEVQIAPGAGVGDAGR